MLRLGVATFGVFGLVLVVLGVHQGEMARDLGLDLSRSGFLGAVLALGFSAGITATGPLVDRLPRKPLFVGLCLVASAALLSVDVDMSYARSAIHLAVIGLGCGGYVTLFNTVAATFERPGPAAALASLHASATLGAGIGPFLIAWATQGVESGWCRTFQALGVWHLVLALWGACSRFPDAGPRAEHAGAPRASVPWLSAEFLALAAVAFAYVGVENGLTLFAVPWAESEGHAQAAGRSAISAFWFGLMTGRLALLVQRRAPGAGLLCACGLAGAAAVGLSLAFSLPPVLALGATGLALGPVYPVTIALTGRRYKHAVGTASGLVAGAGAGGGFCLPWLSGAIGDASSALGAIAALGAGTLLLAFAAFTLMLARSRA